MSKRTLIFVGATKPVGGDQNPGGFATAYQEILSSGFLDNWNPIIVDISSRAFPRENSARLVIRGLKRLAQFTDACRKSRSGVAFIFSAHGSSFYEKILMCLVAIPFGVRCCLYLCSGHFMNNMSTSKAPWLYRWLLSIPHVLLCPSPTWVKFYESMGIKSRSCVVIPNWIDVNRYATCRTEQPRSDSVTFIFVGWLVRSKGVYEFVEAASRIAIDLPGARWMLIGGGPEEQGLRELAMKQGLEERILFTGWATRNEVLHYLTGADVLVLPTHADAFPNVILEAMAAGLPVITTPVGGIPGFIREGENGILVPPGDSSKLAEAMVRLAKDYELRKSLSTASTRYVTRCHDTRVVLEHLHTVLREC